MFGLGALFGGGKDNAVVGSIPGMLMGQSPETIARNQAIIGGAGAAGMAGGGGGLSNMFKGLLGGNRMNSFGLVGGSGDPSGMQAQAMGAGANPQVPQMMTTPMNQNDYQAIRELGRQAVINNQADPMGPPGMPAFPGMGGMPNPMTQQGTQISDRLMVNGNPMNPGIDPSAMAGLAGMLMGGEDRQQPQQRMAPGGGIHQMRQMGLPQMMSTGQMLRRR